MDETEISYHAQVDALFQAGLATHVVDQRTAVDPLFALAKARDFPQVTFAAAFDGGLVVLGCHETVPEPLEGLVRPIQPSPHSPSTTALEQQTSNCDILAAATSASSRIEQDIANVTTQVTSLTRAVADISQILANKPDTGADIMKGQNEAMALQRDVLTRLSNMTSSAQINAQFDTIIDRLEPVQDVSRNTFQLTQMHRELTRSLEESAASLALAQQGTTKDQFASFSDQILKQIPQVIDQQELATAAASLAAQQDQMHEKLSNMANDLAAFCAVAGATTVADPGPGNDCVLEELTMQNTVLQTIGASISQVTDKTDALERSINDLANKPPAQLDVTEKRRGFARFNAAMGTVLTRLETLMAELTDNIQMASDSSLAADNGQERTAEFLGRIAFLEHLPDQLANLNQAIHALPDQHIQLASEIADLRARPDPVLDLTEQRRSFATFASALNTMIKRLESVVATAPNASDDIMMRLDTIAALCRQQGANENFAEAYDKQATLLAGISSAVDAALARPDPVIDLTQQRASFAHFSTAMSANMDRLGEIASQVELRLSAHECDVPNSAAHAEQPEGTKTAQTSPPHNNKSVVFPHNDLEVEEIRTSFAELLARQIMQNSNASEQPQGRLNK